MAQDHPRVRGEKVCPITLKEATAGSPPHTRGKADLPEGGTNGQRITPAYAGKSYSFPGKPGATRDHPRIRGEKDITPDGTAWRTGSPPHTRGKEIDRLTAAKNSRITPAYAGKRLKKSRNYAVFGLPVSAIHSVCDRAQAPGSSLATPCGRIVAPEKDDQPGLQVYSQRHHPPCAGPDQADRGSG